MPSVFAYGFGSHFSRVKSAKDIDILLIHEDITPDSCEMAMRCKRLLAQQLDRAHITVLSRGEEKEFDFIAQCGAVLLGSITPERLEEDVAHLFERCST